MSPNNRETNPDGTGPPDSNLFGRGLLYVVIWSLQLVAGIIVSPILAYTLPPAEFGALASAIALHQVISVLALLGIDKALVLQRSEDGNDRASRGLITVAMVIALLGTLIVGVTAPFWRSAIGFGAYPDLILAVILWTGPGAAVQVMLSLLLTEDRFRSFALLSAISAMGGQTVGLILLFTLHNDATTYAWGGVASQFLAMVVGVVLTRPSIRGLVNWSVAARAIRLGFPLAMAGLAIFLLSAGDRIIIQVLQGTEETGRYQVAYVVGSVVILLLTFTGTAWTPRFAALRDDAARWALAAHSRDELYRVLMPMILGVTVAAPVALRVVAPPSFRPESLAIVVFLVAVSAFPVAASGATGQLLITQRRGTVIGLVTAVAAVTNIVLNFMLVPALGILGAAVATVLAYSLLAKLQRRALPAESIRNSPARLVIKVVVVMLVAAASILLPQSPEWNLVRVVVALGCLPWFIGALKRARGGSGRIRRNGASRVRHRADPGTRHPTRRKVPAL
ncbi:lipopolysaccharide biosynthesis protein [Pseudarthrobacter sp. H2]|uniref:lipopolysaccharide biosynthesis protein n=1 Tax=Pseudarthrobacter sp. H2 TaxID=3418415 RepID=UPI003CE68EA3